MSIQKSSTVLWQYLLISQRQWRISQSLERKLSSRWTLVSFDVSALFTSIPIAVALAVINRKFTEHIDKPNRNTKFSGMYLLHTQRWRHFSFGTSTQELCLLLPGKILPITPKSCNGLPCISNHCQIYMEYLEEIVLGPECPIPTHWWKRYVDDNSRIVKKEQVDTLQWYKFCRSSHQIHNHKFRFWLRSQERCLYLSSLCFWPQWGI